MNIIVKHYLCVEKTEVEDIIIKHRLPDGWESRLGIKAAIKIDLVIMVISISFTFTTYMLN